MIIWESHLRGGHYAQPSQLGLQPGCLHEASPAEVGCWKYPVYHNFLSYSSLLLTIALIGAQISLFFFLFVLYFYNTNKAFFHFETKNMAILNLFFRTVSEVEGKQF